MDKALELADEVMEHYRAELPRGFNVNWMQEAATMLRQQQAEMGELEKENTDLRYLIATKLEQQDGISLNSMAHPITNTPEPSYEIDPDKLETIEVDLPSPEPVVWMSEVEGGNMYTNYEYPDSIPLYTHPAETITLAELRKTELYRTEQTRSLREFLEPKELTKEEISDIRDKYLSPQDCDIYTFAKALLRKAQEK